MKMLAPFRYSMVTCAKGIGVAYGSVLAVNLIVLAIGTFMQLGSHQQDFFSGMQAGLNLSNLGAIMMVVFGMSMYRLAVGFFIQSGRSRVTSVVSMVVTFACLSVAIGLVSMLSTLFIGNKYSLYSMYMGAPMGLSLTRWVWESALLLALSMVGMCLSSIFWRIGSTAGRIVYGVGTPLVLLVVLPKLLGVLKIGGVSLARRLLPVGMSMLGMGHGGRSPLAMAGTLMVLAVLGVVGTLIATRTLVVKR